MNKGITNTLTLSLKSLRWASTPSVQRLALILLLGVCVSLALPFFSSNVPTVSEFDAIPAMLCLGLGLILLVQSPMITPRSSDYAVAIALALLLVIPSFQGALIVLFFVGLWVGIRALASEQSSRDCGAQSHQALPIRRLATRNSALILMVCSAQALTILYALKWFTEPVLALDANMVAALLQLVTGTGHAVGNVYFGPSDHQVLMLRNCSSLPAIISAFACWFAIARWHHVAFSLREVTVVSLLLISALLLNVLRLFSMGLTMEWHTWWHSPTGEDTYLFLSAALTLSIIFWGTRYAKTEFTH
ncbi:hypothetical protein [Enterovibrio norvegicus]|uniref:hypothetical protein n=1 Tax=Enterovibrio norvegicus TaxID=188144 RepID=UPI00354CCD56